MHLSLSKMSKFEQDMISKNEHIRNKGGRKMIWHDKETEYFINLMIQKKRQNLINDEKKFEINDKYDTFNELEREMRDAGFKKNAKHLKTKYKNLKCKYYECNRHNSIPGNDMTYCPFYDLLKNLIVWCPSTNSSDQQNFDHDFNSTEFVDCIIKVENILDSSQIIEDADIDFLDTSETILRCRSRQAPCSETDALGQYQGTISPLHSDNTNQNILKSLLINSKTSTDRIYNTRNTSSGFANKKHANGKKKTEKHNVEKELSYSRALMQFGDKQIEAQKKLQITFFESQERLETKMLQKFQMGQEQLLKRLFEGIGNVLTSKDHSLKTSQKSKHKKVFPKDEETDSDDLHE